MSSVRKVLRCSEHMRDDREKNVVRGHALFVRFMERKGLSDCVRYFPDTMTLGNLRSATPHELMSKYDIRDCRDRDRIMKIVDESHREDQSDNESDYGSSPKQTSCLLSTGSGGSFRREDSSSSLTGSLLSARLLHRTVSEDVRPKLRDKSLLSCGGGLLGKHLSCSQFGLNLSIGSYQPEGSNLMRMHNSGLGKSAPLLSSTLKENGPGGHHTSAIVRRPSARVSLRHSLVLPATSSLSLTLPQQVSTPILLGSPLDSPRSAGHLSQFQFVSGKNLIDSRRWSVASLASSGSGNNTPGTCNVSNLYSSQDRLHHLPSTPEGSSNLLHRHFSSSDSNPVAGDDYQGENAPGSTNNVAAHCPRSPLLRPRSRSLSSPAKAPGLDTGTMLMNNVYRERFPKAVAQMEERLSQFIDSNQVVEATMVESDGAVRFVHHQVIELARDCLNKSKAKLISIGYFYELSENLERLLHDAKERSPSTSEQVTQLIKKLLIIISRPARLLECLEFDPEEFYRLLEAAEGQAKQTIKTDIPRYIISKLGLNRDPLVDLTDVSSVDSGRPDTPDTDESSEQYQQQQLVLTDKQMKTRLLTEKKQPCQDDFETIKLVSNGAYGAVYLVRHRESRQIFAMKRLLKSNLVLRNQVEQVFAERDILTFTDNPFVVSFYCSFETKKHLCMVLEYVEGGDCGTLLKNVGGPLSFDLARMYFAETVLALEYLHSYGIVHRDLKPDNLLITLMGHIKLTDFGLSKMGLMNLTTNLYEGAIDKDCKQFKDKQVFGTPEYIAPEVILRQGYGKPVDWWSMGIILYEFLVGCVPFFGDTPEELFSQVINDSVDWPEEEEYCPPDDAKDIIIRLLNHSPIDRLGSGGVVEVKEHIFFEGLDWDGLLRQKAEFVPQLQNEEDTSYFDSRVDRYNHDLEAEDTEDDSEDIMFNSFSSCSPRYSRVYLKFDELKELGKFTNKTEGDVTTVTVSTEHSTEKVTTNKSSDASIVDVVKTKPNLGILSIQEPVKSDATIATKTTNEVVVTSTTATLVKDSVSKTRPLVCDVSTNTEKAAKGRCNPTSFAYESQLGGKDISNSGNKSQNRVLVTSRDITDCGRLTEKDVHTFSTDTVCLCERREERTVVITEQKSLPKVQLRRQQLKSCAGTNNLPKFSISVEDGSNKEQSTEEKDKEEQDKLGPLRPLPPSKSAPTMPLLKEPDKVILRNKSDAAGKCISKSASALALLMPLMAGDPAMCPESPTAPTVHSPCSGTGSLEGSPSADMSYNKIPRPAITIRRGPRGYGFTLRAIRVYYGDSEYYTLHHLVVAVEANSPAMEAGVRAGDLITHVNDTSVQGLLHIELVRLILTGGNRITIRTVPLCSTSIRIGNRKCTSQLDRLAPAVEPKRHNKGIDEKRRRSSLFRKLSNRKVEQLGSPMSPHRRSLSSIDSLPNSPTQKTSSRSPSLLGNWSQASESPHSTENSSSSSPGSSAPGSPANTIAPFSRPSSLHGLKHKLAINRSSCNRRKSWHNNPLSPLVKTPSPSPLATSPSRSPSPLMVVHGHPVQTAVHQPGISNMTQLYNPSQPQSNQHPQLRKSSCHARSSDFNSSGGSSLLRRALSPERRLSSSSSLQVEQRDTSNCEDHRTSSSSESCRIEAIAKDFKSEEAKQICNKLANDKRIEMVENQKKSHWVTNFGPVEVQSVVPDKRPINAVVKPIASGVGQKEQEKIVVILGGLKEKVESVELCATVNSVESKLQNVKPPLDKTNFKTSAFSTSDQHQNNLLSSKFTATAKPADKPSSTIVSSGPVVLNKVLLPVEKPLETSNFVPLEVKISSGVTRQSAFGTFGKNLGDGVPVKVEVVNDNRQMALVGQTNSTREKGQQSGVGKFQ